MLGTKPHRAEQERKKALGGEELRQSGCASLCVSAHAQPRAGAYANISPIAAPLVLASQGMRTANNEYDLHEEDSDAEGGCIKCSIM